MYCIVVLELVHPMNSPFYIIDEYFRVGNQCAECEKQQQTFFPHNRGMLRRSRCVLIFL